MIARKSKVFDAVIRDTRGVTLVEFGFVGPVLCLMLMALFDLSFQVYAQSIVNGAVQDAARASTLESGSTNSATLDTKVETAVKRVLPNATLTFTRKNYANFEDVGRPEDFTDTDGDGICNNGEPFEDVNGNGAWDADRGADGLGGARDAVLYGATATFNRVFPFHSFVNLPPTVSAHSATVLRNQPFNQQGTRDPVDGTCP